MRQDKKLQKNIKNFCVAIIAVLYIVFVIYNAKTNRNFWEASAINCITVGIAIIISYYLVQKRNDQRKQKEIILDLILKLQNQIEQENMYNFCSQQKEEILLRLRSVNNKIHILQEIAGDYSILEDIRFVDEKFNEYNEFVSNHIEAIEELVNFKLELKRPIDLISNKLVTIALKLYN